MKRYLKSFLALLSMLLAFVASGQQPAGKGIRILFLGDQGHHHPADRFEQLEPTLAQEGIRVTYTEKVSDFNPDMLAGYDGIVIYANHTNISAQEEHALLDFVNNGGGLVALHCASFCFLNSSKYVELVGARFKTHGTGVFEETIVNPDHPVMQGVNPIRSWDETYVHEMHNTNRLVLAERVDGDHREPYTWVRNSGKGRVFYTAWGHDERTWSNTNFLRLVANAIEWTCAPSPNRLMPRAGLPSFQYTNAPNALPNYLPNQKWGTQGTPIQTMQEPLSPEESMRHIVTLPGFRLSLFAAEPDIVKPICMEWDAKGRLWIAETVDYPNQMQPMGQGHDRIVICEDTHGSGHADKFTVFADKLSIPSGFTFYKNGIIVVHSGLTEYIEDTNGDSRADVRRVLFSGWGTKDTHAGPSNLRYGFDNWIWGTVGYSGFDGVVGGKRIRFGQGIFRFRPDGSAIELVRSSNNNTWGLGLSEDNLIFGSTANNNPSMYMPIANRYYEAVNGWSASRIETIADSPNFFPITDKVRQVDWHGRYTAGAGSALYTARQFPSEYWNRVQFVAEPTGHLLGKFHLHPDGADFVACNGRNFLASDDEWTAPICAEVGPDGALWVIDWYNYIIQHNPTPNGFKTGKGSAYETSMRDKVHGRIYRIEYSGGSTRPKFSLTKARSRQLVNALKSDNLFWRMTAQRLLVERGDSSVVPSLCELVRNRRVDEIGLNTAAIHALWTLDGLHAFEHPNRRLEQALQNALQHPSAAVRRAAVMVLPSNAASLDEVRKYNLLRDPDAQVRLATMLAISEMPPNDAIASQLASLLHSTNVPWDRWLDDAATCAAARNDFSFLSAMLASGSATAADEGIGEIVQRVATHYAMRAPKDSVLSLLASINSENRAMGGVLLQSFASAWPSGDLPAIDEAGRKQLQNAMENLDGQNQTSLLLLAQKWHCADLFPKLLSTLTQSLESRLADASLSASERADAAARLVALEDHPRTIGLILAQVNAVSSPALNVELTKALAQSRDPQTGPALVRHLRELTPATRRFQITVLLRRTEWCSALLDGIEKGLLQADDVATEQWAQLKASADNAIASRAETLSGSRGIISPDRAEIVKKFLPVAALRGDPNRGKEVFTQNCAICHTFNGHGGKVGPDLTGVGARDKKDILIDILDPNRSVEANYRAWNVVTRDDETYSGRLETETQTTVEILDSAGQKHVFQRRDIKEMNTSGLSIMPNGFESLSESDLASLLSFLMTPNTAL